MSHDAYPFIPDESGSVMRVNRYRTGERSYLIQLGGELDLQSAVSLRAEVSATLEEQPVPERIAVDLAEVTFVDSLGLGTLVVGHRICAELGVRLTVCNPSPFAARLLEMSGFSDRLLDPAR